ncbi:hypothetical protein NDU88_000489 [Pleurodeles waltl]|uniref:Uncharacterized protein n=1 Tax=Pleurodeles waltl TaxID=8319 RepID=A0AAV7N819_PLEWA|nr:hypothetical protein NDU88_000489 [Pleurodeles waltl]
MQDGGVSLIALGREGARTKELLQYRESLCCRERLHVGLLIERIDGAQSGIEDGTRDCVCNKAKEVPDCALVGVKASSEGAWPAADGAARLTRSTRRQSQGPKNPEGTAAPNMDPSGAQEFGVPRALKPAAACGKEGGVPLNGAPETRVGAS